MLHVLRMLYNIFLLLCGNIYEEKIAIVYVLESPYFSFHEEKSWIKHKYILLFPVEDIFSV